MDNEVYTVGVEPVGSPPLTTPTITPTMAPPPAKPVEKKAPPSVGVKAEEVTIVTPMSGMIIGYQVEVGDKVKADDIVVILEAMKMANAISTPISGRVKAINFKSGDSVARDDVLAVIG